MNQSSMQPITWFDKNIMGISAAKVGMNGNAKISHLQHLQQVMNNQENVYIAGLISTDLLDFGNGFRLSPRPVRTNYDFTYSNLSAIIIESESAGYNLRLPKYYKNLQTLILPWLTNLNGISEISIKDYKMLGCVAISSHYSLSNGVADYTIKLVDDVIDLPNLYNFHTGDSKKFQGLYCPEVFTVVVNYGLNSLLKLYNTHTLIYDFKRIRGIHIADGDGMSTEKYIDFRIGCVNSNVRNIRLENIDFYDIEEGDVMFRFVDLNLTQECVDAILNVCDNLNCVGSLNLKGERFVDTYRVVSHGNIPDGIYIINGSFKVTVLNGDVDVFMYNPVGYNEVDTIMLSDFNIRNENYPYDVIDGNTEDDFKYYVELEVLTTYMNASPSDMTVVDSLIGKGWDVTVN